MSADRIFTSLEFQKRYDEVDISVFTPKCALIPKQFFAPEEARKIVSETTDVSDADVVEYVELPQFASVLVYSNSIGESLSRVISDMVLVPESQLYNHSRKSPKSEIASCRWETIFSIIM